MGKTFQYGGQAVYEGVMMRGPELLSLAVRKPDGDIALETHSISSWAKKYPIWKLPILRGVLALFEALILGVKMLTRSFNLATDDEEEELSPKEMAITIVLAVILSILLFVVLPTAAAHFTKNYLNYFWQNLLEGVLRIGVFMIYVIAIARLEDIQRTFQYHGAEHKVINTLEASEELTVENARKHTTAHPRCGTSFLLFVLVLTILLYSFLDTPGLLWRIGSRILLLPVVAGLAYEFIKWSGKHYHHAWVKILIAPGIWLQKMTTREPDDQQLEVAIAALSGVMDGH